MPSIQRNSQERQALNTFVWTQSKIHQMLTYRCSNTTLKLILSMIQLTAQQATVVQEQHAVSENENCCWGPTQLSELRNIPLPILLTATNKSYRSSMLKIEQRTQHRQRLSNLLIKKKVVELIPESRSLPQCLTAVGSSYLAPRTQKLRCVLVLWPEQLSVAGCSRALTHEGFSSVMHTLSMLSSWQWLS